VRWVALILVLALAGCGMFAKREPVRAGGYYKDDGPGDSPPANLAEIPDAEPRAEPLHRFANRPYQVFGREYVPLAAVGPFRQRGIASWYGRRFAGGKTSSGETYDMYAMTAAHPTLPIPSYARVTSVASGRSVVVRINDRGPFHGGRAIDLSYAAAYRLGFVEAGSALVEIEAIVPGAPVLAAAPPQAQAASVYLQLGAFAARESAENFRARVLRELAWLSQAIHVVAGDALYRLQLGPFRSHDDARRVAERIRAELNVAPLVVVR
jgi:rare lipoprotein A